MKVCRPAIRVIEPDFLLRLAASIGLLAVMGLGGMFLDQSLLPLIGMNPQFPLMPFYIFGFIFALRFSHRYLGVPRAWE